ncbi:hypothetical protein [Uliginosibacterium sp. 31-12]|uniref:hypothetical protein n=1 Tax=Uliginosibacterium sp. 31-12 TaxID=3062781 RepID=UPI0026E46625|nr:hypothetical protein [Uliginosibacterium sp. 31-12]MDO6386117.1 hypothetical protein [Uliginosibacterium sp. 31-12]
MNKQFRIVFEGRLRAGLNRTDVMTQAKLRLGASASQTIQIFSGQRVTLKQGLDAAAALLYQQTLETLGMLVSVEAMDGLQNQPAFASQLAPVLQPPNLPPPRPAAAPPKPAAKPSFPEDWMHRSGFERLEVAQQRLADAEAVLRQSAAEAARQTQRAPADQGGHGRLHSRFVCSHCGTAHEIESELALRITPTIARRQAG